jgi:hypothetical protein
MGDVVSLQGKRAAAATASALFAPPDTAAQPAHVVFATLKEFMRADADSITAYACFFSLSPAQALHALNNQLIDQGNFQQREIAARLHYDEMYVVVPGMQVALEFEPKPGPNRLVTRVVPASKYQQK